eukprot:m.718937 g.718937  ORF g.718937 m.718937 type:complete len:771 (+) comp22997_c1_seq34:676-2988(+)
MKPSDFSKDSELIFLFSLVSCCCASSEVVNLLNASMDTAFTGSMANWTCESGSFPSACISGDYELGVTWFPHTEDGHVGLWFVSTGGATPHSFTGTLQSPPIDVANYSSITLSFTIGVGGTSTCVSNFPTYDLVPLIYNAGVHAPDVLFPSKHVLSPALPIELTEVSFDINTSSFASTMSLAINRTTTNCSFMVRNFLISSSFCNSTAPISGKYESVCPTPPPTASPTVSEATTTASGSSGGGGGAPTISGQATTKASGSSSNESSGGGGGGGGAAIGGAIIAVVLVLLLVLAYVFRDKIRSKMGQGKSGGPMVSNRVFEHAKNHGANQDCDMYQDPAVYADPTKLLEHIREWSVELPRDAVKFTKELGHGEFGEVFLGTLKSRGKTIDCACKTLRKGAKEQDKLDFLSEAGIMGQFRHPNVVSLLGVVLDGSPNVIVLELMEEGALIGYLEEHRGGMKLEQQIRFGLDVANGMAYLASKLFVHRDLAARNILVNRDLTCKVADFGLSKSLDDDSEYFRSEGGKIPIRWTAPEAMAQKKYTTSSDVWSYGILLWEIMSGGERPYADMDNLKVVTEVDRGYRMPEPDNCPKALHRLMLRCWEADRRRRMEFADIAANLEARLVELSETGYLKIEADEDVDADTATDGGVIAPSEYGEPQNAAPAPVAPVRAAARLPAAAPGSDYRTESEATAPTPSARTTKVTPDEYGLPQDATNTDGDDSVALISKEDASLDEYAEPQDNMPIARGPVPAARGDANEPDTRRRLNTGEFC